MLTIAWFLFKLDAMREEIAASLAFGSLLAVACFFIWLRGRSLRAGSLHALDQAI